jgi:hypothetical protein
MKNIFAILVLILVLVPILLIAQAGAANYMYEKSSVKGVGYLEQEKIVQTQVGFSGQKLVEHVAGSGNVILLRTELEAERQLTAEGLQMNCTYPNTCAMDYINYTKEAEFEYMPVSYQTGTYDAKWVDKLCVQNYRIGAVLTEMYSHAEHLQRSTEIKTRGYQESCVDNCCTGVLEANINSNVIGVAHIGWLSRDPEPNRLLKGRHAEYGRSVEDLTGVFAVEKFVQLWGNSTCGAISVDWLPCM